MIKLNCEVVLPAAPTTNPPERSVFPALDPAGRVHVLMWDAQSIYPRQSLVFDGRHTPAEVAAWLYELGRAVESLGRQGVGVADGVAGSPAPGDVPVILCAHADQNGEGAHWKLPGEPCTGVSSME